MADVRLAHPGEVRVLDVEETKKQVIQKPRTVNIVCEVTYGHMGD